MKILIHILFVSLLAITPIKLMAHANHGSFTPISQAKAEDTANKLVQNLVNTKKLAASWKSAAAEKAVKKETNRGPVWEIIFNNSQEEDDSKKTLHVFLDEFGNPITANHDGKM